MKKLFKPAAILLLSSIVFMFIACSTSQISVNKKELKAIDKIAIMKFETAAGIDKKIAMYEEENAGIEQQITDVVKQYQEYESGIFKDIAPESVITLVTLYPELKSDTLVQSQIEVYIENNKEIKELKNMTVNASFYRWWLYFGK